MNATTKRNAAITIIAMTAILFQLDLSSISLLGAIRPVRRNRELGSQDSKSTAANEQTGKHQRQDNAKPKEKRPSRI
jgi:hypothetical protein